MRKQRPARCSYETGRRIEAQLPPEVVAALSHHGWNALGVYDLVRRELAAERRMATTTGGIANQPDKAE